MTVFGTVYLKSEGAPCDVYFDKQNLSFGEDDQMLAACRLGIKINTINEGEVTYIFKLDDLGNASGAAEQDTMSESDVVISGADSSGTGETSEDPSKEIGLYCAVTDEEDAIPGENKLCSLQADEIASVSYRVYIEGCDPNSINEVQEKDFNLKLAFAGTQPDEAE